MLSLCHFPQFWVIDRTIFFFFPWASFKILILGFWYTLGCYLWEDNYNYDNLVDCYHVFWCDTPNLLMILYFNALFRWKRTKICCSSFDSFYQKSKLVILFLRFDFIGQLLLAIRTRQRLGLDFDGSYCLLGDAVSWCELVTFLFKSVALYCHNVELCIQLHSREYQTQEWAH